MLLHDINFPFEVNAVIQWVKKRKGGFTLGAKAV